MRHDVVVEHNGLSEAFSACLKFKLMKIFLIKTSHATHPTNKFLLLVVNLRDMFFYISFNQQLPAQNAKFFFLRVVLILFAKHVDMKAFLMFPQKFDCCKD